MYTLGLVLFSLILFFWIFYGLRVAYGVTKLPWIKDFVPAADSDCPRISLIFAARDEEEKLPAALATLAALDYPQLQIIGVDDRSRDGTGRILDEFALAHPRIRAVHVTELPSGWLGKTHALQKAYEVSTGEWLLFTDADVRFKPEVLRRAITLARERNLDHLTLLCQMEMVGFWETVLVTFFCLAFYMASDPFRAGNPNSRFYVGVGAFQLVKRSAYEASGTHRRLAMEVIDDMKLGKIIKQAGFRSGVGIAQDEIAVRWHAGLSNLIHGVSKNSFAAAGYSLTSVIAGMAGLLIVNVAPFLGLVVAHGWIRIIAAVAVGIALYLYVGVDVTVRVSPLYAFTLPLGALLFSYALLRSTVITLRQGGIVWRGTFYPLDELRRSGV